MRAAAVALLLTLLPVAPRPALAARAGASSATLLVVEQAAATDARGLVTWSTLTARLRRPGSTAQGLALPWSASFDRSVDTSGLGISPLAWVDPPLASTAFGVPVAPGDGLAARVDRLTATATAATARVAPALAARIRQVLQAQEVDEAWFNFRQQLPVAGQARQLAWTLHVAASGVWFAGTPAVDAPGAALLHVSYTPLAAVAGLPAAYHYADGGWLRWSLSDASGRSLPGGGARDTGGAFDGATGLACLLGVATGAHCDPAQEAVPGLLERLGAAQADATVASALQPVYAVTSAGQRLALASLAVDRSLAGSGRDCATPPWRYTNAYHAAFRLQARLDHYQRRADGHWSLQSSTLARSVAPMVAWKTLSLPLDASAFGQLAQLLIDPDTGRLVALDAFPAGIEQVDAGPVRCQPA